MAVPILEAAVGVVNGVNRDYYASVAYQPGRLSVFVDGQLLERSLDDGWEEAGPASGLVRLKRAPLTGSVVQLLYVSVLPGEAVVRLQGDVSLARAVAGSLRGTSGLAGSLQQTTKIIGRLEAV